MNPGAVICKPASTITANDDGTALITMSDGTSVIVPALPAEAPKTKEEIAFEIERAMHLIALLQYEYDKLP